MKVSFNTEIAVVYIKCTNFAVAMAKKNKINHSS